MSKIMDLLRFLKLAREVQGANPDAEVSAAKRGGKGLIAGLLGGMGAVVSSVTVDFLTAQTGPGCILGPTTCAVLATPWGKAFVVTTVCGGIVGGVMAAEKYANEKWGLGIQLLDTVNRTPDTLPQEGSKGE